MQIVFPTAVTQVRVKPTEKDASCQTLSLPSQQCVRDVFSHEIVAPPMKIKEYSYAQIQTEIQAGKMVEKEIQANEAKAGQEVSLSQIEISGHKKESIVV